MDQKTCKHTAQIHKNRSKIGPWALLERSWGQLGDHLGPKSSQEPFGGAKSISLDPPWPPKMGPCWRVLGHVAAMLAGFGGRLVVRRPSYPA